MMNIENLTAEESAIIAARRAMPPEVLAAFDRLDAADLAKVAYYVMALHDPETREAARRELCAELMKLKRESKEG